MITWVLSYSSISALTADFNTHNFTDTSRRFSSSFVVVFKDKKPPPSRVHVISKFIPYPNQPQSLWTANYFNSLKWLQNKMLKIWFRTIQNRSLETILWHCFSYRHLTRFFAATNSTETIWSNWSLDLVQPTLENSEGKRDFSTYSLSIFISFYHQHKIFDRAAVSYKLSTKNRSNAKYWIN